MPFCSTHQRHLKQLAYTYWLMKNAWLVPFFFPCRMIRKWSLNAKQNLVELSPWQVGYYLLVYLPCKSPLPYVALLLGYLMKIFYFCLISPFLCVMYLWFDSTFHQVAVPDHIKEINWGAQCQSNKWTGISLFYQWHGVQYNNCI